MILFELKRRCLSPMGGRPQIGGPKSGGIGNSGPSSTSQTTESNDMRVVGAENSVNTSTKFDVSGDNTQIVTTDYGAVDGALQLAFAGVEGAQKIATQTIAANGDLLTGALSMAGSQQAAFTSAIENIKTSDVRVLVIAGLAVVGLGAVTLLQRKG